MSGVDSRARTGMGDVLQVWIPGPLPRGCRGHHGSLRVGGGDPVSPGFQTGKMRERLLWKGEDLGVGNLRTQGKTGVQVLLSSIRKKCGIVPVRSDP